MKPCSHIKSSGIASNPLNFDHFLHVYCCWNTGHRWHRAAIKQRDVPSGVKLNQRWRFDVVYHVVRFLSWLLSLIHFQSALVPAKLLRRQADLDEVHSREQKWCNRCNNEESIFFFLYFYWVTTTCSDKASGLYRVNTLPSEQAMSKLWGHPFFLISIFSLFAVNWYIGLLFGVTFYALAIQSVQSVSSVPFSSQESEIPQLVSLSASQQVSGDMLPVSHDLEKASALPVLVGCVIE